MRTRLGKIVIGAIIGAGALGAGFGASMAVAGAATMHAATSTSSSGAATTAVGAATPSPAPSSSHRATHNCPNMNGARDDRPAPSGRASTDS